MHILVAPNAFKNSLPATAVADAICEGLQQSRLSCTCQTFPVGDGGDGTADLLINHLKGEVITVQVQDPLGRKIDAGFGLIDEGRTAVIEMAHASGLRLLHPSELNPLRTTSFGTGELILAALDRKVSKIILCIGGSATVDGATGILRALGIRFLDAAGLALTILPETLPSLAQIDLSGLDKRVHQCEIHILCDVKNTLLGEQGAAAVFGPQKGATPPMVAQLETALSQLRTIAYQETGKDMATLEHGGAAGGIAAGLAVLLNASLLNGTDQFLDLTGFNEALQQADLVITGEGSLDVQTLQGKAPFGVALRAREKNIPVIGIAGKVPVAIDPLLQSFFDVLLPIGHEPLLLADALPYTTANLIRTGRLVGDLLALRVRG